FLRFGGREGIEWHRAIGRRFDKHAMLRQPISQILFLAGLWIDAGFLRQRQAGPVLLLHLVVAAFGLCYLAILDERRLEAIGSKALVGDADLVSLTGRHAGMHIQVGEA